MTQMLADVLRDHLINLKDNGVLPTNKKEVESYIHNSLNPGAVAYAIDEAMKTASLEIVLEPEIIIFA